MREYIRSSINDESLLKRRRSQIIESAEKLFVQQGFASTNIRDIAKEAGLTTGGLYRYIGSKNDIVHLMCLDSKESIKRLKKILDGCKSPDISEKLKISIRDYIKWVVELSDKHIFYNREIYHFTHQDRAMLMQSQTDYIEFFDRLILQGVEEGKFVAKYHKLLAHNIVLLAHDWILRKWYLSDYFSLDQYIDAQTDMIINLLTNFDITKTGNDIKHTKTKLIRGQEK